MTLREALVEIRAKYNELTPALVVQEFSDPAHPHHRKINWDDASAADEHRLSQARQLIRSVRVKYREADELRPAGYVRAFHAVAVPGSARPVYEPLERIAADPVATELLLRQMRRDWETLRRRYEAFAEFWDLVRAELAA